MVTLRIRVPAPSSMLLANLLAVLGLVAVVVAVGGLAGAWWATLTGGLLAIGVAWAAMANAAAAEPLEVAPPAAAPVDELAAVRPVEEPAAA